MSQSNYILNLLDIKDKNIKLNENNLFYEKYGNIVLFSYIGFYLIFLASR